MNGMFGFFIYVLGVGLLFSFLGLILEKLLIVNGIARGDSLSLVIGSFIAALFQQVNPGPLNWLFCVLGVVFMPLIANRTDIYYTVEKGRWWWKNKNNTKKN